MTEADNALAANHTTAIVAAYISHNAMSRTDVPAFIGEVYAAVRGLGTPAAPPEPERKPAIDPRKSITPDFIICLEDGKKFKSLKRHIRTHYNLSPEQYREKWRLPHDYPMAAPNYSLVRSQLARDNGLGKKAG